jgi:hypothetical protein
VKTFTTRFATLVLILAASLSSARGAETTQAPAPLPASSAQPAQSIHIAWDRVGNPAQLNS